MRPDEVCVGTPYSSSRVHDYLCKRWITAMTPKSPARITNCEHKGFRGGRSTAFDTVSCRSPQRCRAPVLQSQATARPSTRYDKHALGYRADVVIGAVIAWFKIIRGPLYVGCSFSSGELRRRGLFACGPHNHP